MTATSLDGPAPIPESAPPPRSGAASKWAKQNLFTPWYNTVLTVVFGALLLWLAWRAFLFVFVNGRWEVIKVNLTNLMVGLFPRPEVSRAWVALFVVAAATGLVIGMSSRLMAERMELPLTKTWSWDGARRAFRRLWPALVYLGVLVIFSPSMKTTVWIVCLVICAAGSWLVGRNLPWASSRSIVVVGAVGIVAPFVVMLASGGPPLSVWGGLLLTVFLAASGIVISFPIGVALALGRRSTLPVVKLVSVLYIEIVRGVPLITILFMGSLMIQFFLPEQVGTPSLTIRAVTALVIFTAAYQAEIVRGGLQSVPKGQVEAAQALGLRPYAQMRRVVLPQALRAVIPAIVGQFISLLKDTSLVAIIGLNDLLAMSRSITSQGDFVGQGLLAETLAFASFTYWVISFTISQESQRLERRLGTGQR